MIKTIHIFFLLFIFTLNFQANSAYSSDLAKANNWQNLDEGLDYFLLEELLNIEETELTRTFKVHFLRIDPKLYEFHLFGRFLESDNMMYTLPSWVKNKNLVAAINASMYLPDYTKSNGYMISGSSINNSHIAKQMGAFFVSSPLVSHITSSMILEKNFPNFREEMKNYKVVIQNFRIIGNYDSSKNSSEVLWKKDTKRTPISAIGQDTDGFIYFIFSEIPQTVYDFANFILAFFNNALPSSVTFKSIIYTEGGKDAGLFINSNNKTLFANSSSLFTDIYIPNILGIKKR